MDIERRTLKTGALAVVVVAVATISTSAHAGWEGSAPTVIDGTGPAGGRPDLQFTIATQGFPAPTKINGLAYVDEASNSIRYAQRHVEVGDYLATATWTTEDVDFPTIFPAVTYDWPALAMDPVTGRPYIVYSIANKLWLATRVGPGGGNCGTGLAWQCESISAACETPVYGLFGKPQVELGGVFGMEADTVHIVNPGSSLLDIRKDLENDEWTCTVVPSASTLTAIHGDNYRCDTTSFRHESDDRIRPQVAYYGDTWPSTPRLTGLIFRSLQLFVDIPVPAWSLEYLVSLLPTSLKLGMLSVARLDDGLASNAPSHTGFGVPAIASVALQHVVFDANEAWSCGGLDFLPYDLEYRVAEEVLGSSWTNSEVAYTGEPCWPSMDIGWGRHPYVTFVEQTTDEIMVTTRRPGVGWRPAQTVAPNGVMPSIAYDYENGTIAIAYKDIAQFEVAVVDGIWPQFGGPVGPYSP
ncbi:MAG: hypothetical protein K0V04_46120 [Deltaproteobacteria bacterium]|nr:hypothetical protein [Deltaproteobacteria bacterium]